MTTIRKEDLMQIEDGGPGAVSVFMEALRQARIDALEEAAQTVEALYGRGLTLEQAAAIRALKDKQP